MVEMRKPRILTLTGLYPNSIQPNHGIFVESRVSRTQNNGQFDHRVVAPVPWFPTRHPIFGEWARYAAVPRHEARLGLRIDHPRYPTIPRFGQRLQPYLYYRFVLPHIRRLVAAEGPFDLIDAHYLYPDGVAAGWIAAKLGIPYVMTARGSDVTLLPKDPVSRRLILTAVAKSAAVACVADSLAAELIALGADPAKLCTIRNGVDQDLFTDGDDRAATRAQLGVPIDAPLAVSVGGLITRKGHDLSIAAIAANPGVYFLIAGEGPERAALQAQIDRAGVADRIRLLGPIAHRALPALYRAADLSILSSDREGVANVLLESMACGTPVVATAVWGAPEVMTEPAAGQLVATRSAPAIAAAIAKLLANLPARAATRAYARRFSWENSVAGVEAMFHQALGTQPGL